MKNIKYKTAAEQSGFSVQTIKNLVKSGELQEGTTTGTIDQKYFNRWLAFCRVNKIKNVKKKASISKLQAQLKRQISALESTVKKIKRNASK